MPCSPRQDLANHALTRQIKLRAWSIGFDLVGIAPAEPSRFRGYLRTWLDTGQAGEMAYLGNRFDERTDPATYLPGARSVICAAINYHVPLQQVAPDQRQHHGRIARYALGDDYHELLKTRLHKLADRVREMVPGSQTRACVDTAPVMEKELATRAGIGWMGKNTCVISPEIGSWLLLGEILTTIALPADEPETDHCGTCTRCIDACPTGAITAPYQLDARRCISYLTIEHRGPIPSEYEPLIGQWLCGCDICQDVCPHNSKAPVAEAPELQPRFRTGTLDIRQVLDWSERDYQSSLRGSAMKRVKLPILQRNARIVASNSPRTNSAPTHGLSDARQ